MIAAAPHVSSRAVPAPPLIRNGSSQNGALHASVLALNRNYVAVHVVSVRRAFCLLCKELAEVIHVDDGCYHSYDFESWREVGELRAALGERDEHEDWVQAVNFEIQVPRIIRLLKYNRLPRNAVKFNRRNVFLRDAHRCQYCGKRYATGGLSLDHVLPRSRGGADSWENVVCACLTCNVRKGGRTPTEAGMRLLRLPVKPARSPLLSRQLSLRKYAAWRSFLGNVPHVTDV
jgi:5-methylcytosine-specific restriction endonuclease McrA